MELERVQKVALRSQGQNTCRAEWSGSQQPAGSNESMQSCKVSCTSQNGTEFTVARKAYVPPGHLLEQPIAYETARLRSLFGVKPSQIAIKVE